MICQGTILVRIEMARGSVSSPETIRPDLPSRQTQGRLSADKILGRLTGQIYTPFMFALPAW